MDPVAFLGKNGRPPTSSFSWKLYRPFVVPPDTARAVGSPTAPEVYHTRTILFAAEVRMRECAVKGIFCLLYIHLDFSLH